MYITHTTKVLTHILAVHHASHAVKSFLKPLNKLAVRVLSDIKHSCSFIKQYFKNSLVIHEGNIREISTTTVTLYLIKLIEC